MSRSNWSQILAYLDAGILSVGEVRGIVRLEGLTLSPQEEDDLSTYED